MILQELVELAHREGTPCRPGLQTQAGTLDHHDHPHQAASWVNRSTRRRKKDKGKAKSKVIYVPRNRARTCGSLAGFLVDKAEYVLGFDPDDQPSKRGRLALHRRLFAEFIESALEIAPGDIGLLAVLGFVRDDEQVSRCVEALGGRAVANDLLAFQVLDENGRNLGLVHEGHPVRKAWKTLRGGSRGNRPKSRSLVSCAGSWRLRSTFTLSSNACRAVLPRESRSSRSMTRRSNRSDSRGTTTLLSAASVPMPTERP